MELGTAKALSSPIATTSDRGKSTNDFGARLSYLRRQSTLISQEAVAALVIRAQHGEADAFGALVRAFLRAAYSVALAIVARPADAEDVAQDAFVVAMERIGTCREPARFAGWLLQIVRNRARNWLDSRRLRDVSAQDGPRNPAAAADRSADAGLRERLTAALGELPPTQREVVLLHDLEEWTHGEIGAALGISEVMSRQHLFHARRVLRGQLLQDAPSETA